MVKVTIVYKPSPDCPEGEAEVFNFQEKESARVFAERKRKHYSVEKVIVEQKKAGGDSRLFTATLKEVLEVLNRTPDHHV